MKKEFNEQETKEVVMAAIGQAIDEDSKTVLASEAFPKSIYVNPKDFNAGLIMLKRAGNLKLSAIRNIDNDITDIKITVINW